MILSNFYTVIHQQSDGNQLIAGITINPDHEIFKGHFPDQPVVPGVCMVEIVKELMELHFEQPLRVTKASQIKFLQLIVPDQNQVIQVTINWQPAQMDTYAITAQWQIRETIAFKLIGIVANADK